MIASYPSPGESIAVHHLARTTFRVIEVDIKAVSKVFIAAIEPRSLKRNEFFRIISAIRLHHARPCTVELAKP